MHNCGIPEKLGNILPRLGMARLYKIMARTKSANLAVQIAYHCPYDQWDAVSRTGRILAVVMGSRDAVQYEVMTDPTLGQLALANPRFQDKDYAFQKWVKRYKYWEPHWFERCAHYPELLGVKSSVCRLAGTKTSFFTEARINALAMVAADQRDMTVVVTKRTKKKLVSYGFPVEQVLDVCEYEAMVEAEAAPEPEPQTNQGLR